MLDRLTKLREERANSDKGFTLIELLVVVVIIGILIAIAIPLYLNYTKSAKQKSAQSDVRNAVATLEQCNSDNSVYPTGYASGAFTGSCTSSTIATSTGNTVFYSPTSTGASYVIEIQGTDKTIFCYNSAVGGSVAKVTSTTTGATNLTACPA